MLKNRDFYIVISVIVFIQLIMSFQGFDICDEGFSLTHYQQIFTNPSSVEYNAVYWLAGFVGGLWYNLYPGGGILWFRFLAIIVNTLTLVMSYKILKPYLDKRLVLIGVIMVLFVSDFGYLVFYHNYLTAFLAVTSVYYLFRGLRKNNNLLIMLSGIIIGANIFTRLPNVTLSVFGLAIPFMGYCKTHSIKTSMKPFFLYVTSIVLGAAIIIVLLYGLGQLDEMGKAIGTIFNLGKSKNSGHDLTDMLQVYASNYSLVLKRTLQLFSISVFFLYFSSSKRLVFRITSYLFTGIVLFFLFRRGHIHIIYALGFIGTLGVLATKQKTIEIKVLAFLALLMMVFLPLGSGGGMHSSGFMCIWLAIPFFLVMLSQMKQVQVSFQTRFDTLLVAFKEASYSKLLTLLVVVFFAVKAYAISKEAYFDFGSRFNKQYKINNTFARGIYTKKRRADIVNDLLKGLEHYVSPGDYLLVYDKSPMIHFLTETKPYMYNPWVWIYDGHSFEEKLKTAEQEIHELPIIVQQKFETIYEFSEPFEDYMNEHKEDDNRYNKRRTKAMNAFIRRHHYDIVWSNSYFNIYQSKKLK